MLDNYFMPQFESHEIELKIRFKALIYVLLLMAVIVILAAVVRYSQSEMQQALLDALLSLVLLFSLIVLKQNKNAYGIISRSVIILSLMVMIPGLYIGNILILSLAAYVMTLFMMVLFIQSAHERWFWYFVYFIVYLLYIDVFVKQGIPWSIAIAIGVGIVAITLMAHTNNVLNVAAKEYQMQIYHEKRTQLLGNMVSMIAHQWRQPLAAIGSVVGGLQLSMEMGDAYDPNELTLALENITEQTTELSHILNVFTSIYFEEGAKKLTSLSKVIKESVKEYRYSGQEYNVKKNIYLMNDLAADICETEVKIVIATILDNAYDQFVKQKTEGAYIDLTLLESDDQAMITILSNSGPIDTNDLERLFDPYFSTKESKNGVGLGLYIAQTLIQKNGGKIVCRNEQIGVLFEIVLPKVTQDAESVLKSK